jgi:hypothetical protein
MIYYKVFFIAILWAPPHCSPLFKGIGLANIVVVLGSFDTNVLNK